MLNKQLKVRQEKQRTSLITYKGALISCSRRAKKVEYKAEAQDLIK